MHRLDKTLAVAVATATALVVLGLSASAQAQPASPAVRGGDPQVPAGVETTVGLTACPGGNTVSSVTSVPKLPATVNPITQANKAKLSGDWPKPPPSSYAVTLHCSGGSTVKSAITVLAAPAEIAIVGVGSDTYQSVADQFSADYNATLKGTSTRPLYNWDATNPTTGQALDPIVTKSGCSSIQRPDGGSAGLSAMDANAKTSDGKQFCIDFTRIARARSSSDPPFAPGGVAFVTLAEDAITYSTQTTTDAPSNLTTAQLAGIYNCTITNWSAVGGKNATIKPVLPLSGSSLAKQFLTDIGVSNAGACVNQTAQQNDGVQSVLDSPQVIFPYSAAKWIAQKFHSAHCLNSGCTPNSSGVVCTPVTGQDQFGCDQHGTLKLNSINGIVPTTGTGKSTTINQGFYQTSYGNPISDVVRYDSTTTDHIPAYLEPIFGVSGWACTNTTAKADLKNYGFVLSPLCGVAS
jgi:ABC-type phosphate transport system substrate-binding protein